MLGVLAIALPAVLPPLIHLVEKLITGEKQGPTKKELVLDSAMRSVDVLLNSGKVKPEDAQNIRAFLGSIVDARVTEMNDSGELAGKTVTYSNLKSVTLTL